MIALGYNSEIQLLCVSLKAFCLLTWISLAVPFLSQNFFYRGTKREVTCYYSVTLPKVREAGFEPETVAWTAWCYAMWVIILIIWFSFDLFYSNYRFTFILLFYSLQDLYQSVFFTPPSLYIWSFLFTYQYDLRSYLIFSYAMCGRP